MYVCLNGCCFCVFVRNTYSHTQTHQGQLYWCATVFTRRYQQLVVRSLESRVIWKRPASSWIHCAPRMVVRIGWRAVYRDTENAKLPRSTMTESKNSDFPISRSTNHVESSVQFEFVPRNLSLSIRQISCVKPFQCNLRHFDSSVQIQTGLIFHYEFVLRNIGESESRFLDSVDLSTSEWLLLFKYDVIFASYSEVPHEWMICVERRNESCHTYKWVTSDISMIRATHLYRSCHARISLSSGDV